MNNKIVLAFAIAVVGVIVDCRSSERQNEDAGTSEQNILTDIHAAANWFKWFILTSPNWISNLSNNVLANFTAVREANQELNDYLAGSQEVTDGMVVVKWHDLMIYLIASYCKWIHGYPVYQHLIFYLWKWPQIMIRSMYLHEFAIPSCLCWHGFYSITGSRYFICSFINLPVTDEVKQAIEQLETADGTETVDGTELPREAEGIGCVPVMTFILNIVYDIHLVVKHLRWDSGNEVKGWPMDVFSWDRIRNNYNVTGLVSQAGKE